jgi:hypothetical protein
MPFGFVETARTFAGISVVAAPSTSEFNGIQLARADHWFGGFCSVFFARTHELLQYHFRTVTLAFEYDKDGSQVAEHLGVARSWDGKGLRSHET